MNSNKAYRYKDTLYSWGDNGWAFVRVHLEEFNVIKETPKGIWIQGKFGGRKHFILLTARKKYACLSKEDAKVSFIARKERQIRILESQLNHAKDALRQGELIA